jgi:hypothetical protein
MTRSEGEQKEGASMREENREERGSKESETPGHGPEAVKSESSPYVSTR